MSVLFDLYPEKLGEGLSIMPGRVLAENEVGLIMI